ncbi:MFS transporter (macronuclear) [Tetrahymena thermophila SB210]|uniref:MFS transporter n=1 Tax=Tetrahymena thermophila (strain SB210) TaxID=312017 RepID=W7X6Z4_TETTS|nr:MFS transporter [Tetrahymena thermophila SB210]EWS75150.1 MFS transporter [Tetrahymena thermophila SB210]|eukprot:XP_012652306.1 MFS transporter [Tetrahymena thermophila SB210]
MTNQYSFLSYRHWDFPSGPPPQYQPSLKALNFGVRMGSGVFTLVWPITKLIQIIVIDTGTSQAVPHLSTNPALRRLTSEFEWDPVFSPQYGRQQNQYKLLFIQNKQYQIQQNKKLRIKRKSTIIFYKYFFIIKIKKGYRHWDFPSGPPPQYQPSLKALNFGVRMGSGVFTLVWPITKLIQIIVIDTGTSQAVPHLSTNPALRRLTSEFEWDPVFSPQYGRQQNQQNQCYRHWDFPSGPPPQYQPSLKALNFGVRMGSGVFTLVWPITKLIELMSNQKI